MREEKKLGVAFPFWVDFLFQLGISRVNSNIVFRMVMKGGIMTP
jgi:hypothetical protein